MLIPVLRMNRNYDEAVAVSKSLAEVYKRGEDSDTLWQDLITAAKNATGRTCGTCNMCCYALDIAEPLHKPSGEMCKHCDPGNGCKIYKDRPPVCSGYYCTWLADDFFGPEWFPAESKILVQRRTSDRGVSSYHFIVDPAYEDRWREEPYFSTLKQVAHIGLNEQSFYAIVLTGNRTFMMLPNGPVEVTGYTYVPVRTGPTHNDWDVKLFKDAADGHHFANGRKLALEVTQHMPSLIYTAMAARA